MPIPIKCAKCGCTIWVSPSTAKRIKHCPKCKGSQHRKSYTCNNSEFKKYLQQYKKLIYWKANEVAQGRLEVFEELTQRYMITLYRHISRMNSIKNFNYSLHMSMKYETCQYFKELESVKESPYEPYVFKTIEYIESKMDAQKIQNEVLDFCKEHNYIDILASTLGYSHLEIANITKRTPKGVSSAIDRQRQMLRKTFNIFNKKLLTNKK